MRNILFTICWLLCGQLPVWAQTTTSIEPLDKLVAAMQTQSTDLIKPYLLPETQISYLPAAYTPQVLAQMLPRFKEVEKMRVVRQTPEGENIRCVFALTQAGSEKEYDVLLTPAGKLREINLTKAEAKEVSTRFRTQELTTPALVEMPIRLRSGLVVVTAEIDGQRGDFLLDSGAPMMILNKNRFAAPTGSLGAGSQIRGVNGDGASFDVYHAQSFNWQGISFQDHDVPTLDLTDLAKRAGIPELLGLIGYNLLDQYALTLDYANQKLTLRKPTANGPSTKGVPFVLRGHLPVVEATVAGQVLKLAFDTGAQQNLLDTRYATQFASQLSKSEQQQLAGADQKTQSVTSGELRTLQLTHGPIFRKQPTVFADISHLNQKADRVALDGLLGYPILSQQVTTIDYVNKVVQFGKP